MIKGAHFIAVLVLGMALSVKAVVDYAENVFDVDIDEVAIPPPPPSTKPPPKFCSVNKCGNHLIKYYRDPADPSCHHFCQCSNGNPYRFVCPKNVKFNPIKKVCDWPQNVPVC
jgi:hypothetical protein